MDKEKELFLKYNLPFTFNQYKPKVTEAIKAGANLEYWKPSDDKILLLLKASYACNSNCIYCENHVLREKYGHLYMEESMVREVVRKLGPILREVTWHGGEPLLLPDNLLIALEDERKKMGLNFTVTLQSNGILLSKEKEKLLKDLNIGCGFSFDGMFNTRHRGQNTTNALIKLIEQNKVDSCINVNTKESIYHLIENYEYCKRLGIQKLQSAIVHENVIEEGNLYSIPNDIAIEKVLEYFDYWIYDLNNPIEDTYLKQQLERVLGRVRICTDSDCIGRWLTIEPTGNLAYCGCDTGKEFFVNIKDIKDYHELLEHKKYISVLYKQKQLIKNKCSDCEWLHVCNGSCMGLNYIQNHDFTELNTKQCEYNKRLLEGIYERIKNIDITRKDLYNPYFLATLKKNCYYSLDEIYKIEEEIKNNA